MRNGSRIAAVAGATGALFLGAAAIAQAADSTLSIRLPQVPAETLPPIAIPGDPSAPLQVRIDPGDNEAPDPAPQLVVTVRGT